MVLLSFHVFDFMSHGKVFFSVKMTFSGLTAFGIKTGTPPSKCKEDIPVLYDTAYYYYADVRC